MYFFRVIFYFLGKAYASKWVDQVSNLPLAIQLNYNYFICLLQTITIIFQRRSQATRVPIPAIARLACVTATAARASVQTTLSCHQTDVGVWD